MTTEATPKQPKFPDVKVKLTGMDGNAFTLMGKVSAKLRKAGHGGAVAEFRIEAMSGDYDHMLQTCVAYVTVK